jgi:asparagine synthase (glutamine-hydrolysing)
MCGIAGICAVAGAPDGAVLDAMAEALGHRGPDGEGRHISGSVGMVHTRLAIVDLETGDQPIGEWQRDNGAVLVANGEIYNDPDLRDAYDDIAFATRSDCEPPLHLWRHHGCDFTDHMRGMYAIAIHDRETDRLILTRDPFGIKPLYVTEGDFGLAFASEPQAFLAAGLVEPEVDPQARDAFLQLQFSTGRQTLFRGVERILPGETITVSGGRVVSCRRPSALPESRGKFASEDEALQAFDAALEDTVRCHRRADVPYGMFLSGGLDSSAVLAMMARLDSAPVLAYTAGFPGTGVADERARAAKIAAAVGAEHREIEVTAADFWGLLPRIAAAVDDACADYAIVPSYLLAQAAAEDVKVVLTGEGGDEMLAGYGRYRAALRPRLLGGKPMRGRGIFDGLGVLRQAPMGWRDGIAAAEATARAGSSRLQALQAGDIAEWLPNDLLIKLDRCLMAHGLEGRTPFVDIRFAEFAYALPDQLKLRGRLGKWLLRRWLAEALPVAEPFADKRGFTVPVGAWMAEQAARLGPLLAAQPGIAEICLPGSVEGLFSRLDKRRTFAAWTLLFYALWHRAHILRQPAGGDVFDCLMETA